MNITRRSQPFAHHHGLPAFLRRSLSVLGVLLLLLLLVKPDVVQAQKAPVKGYWKQHFEAQINTLLRSSNPALRERGMELIIKFQNDEASTFDFSSARSQLYSIFFDRTNSDEHRIFALSALYATDSMEMTSKTLAGWIDEEPSLRVRRHIWLALQQQSG